MDSREAVEMLRQSNEELASHIENLKDGVLHIEKVEVSEEDYRLLSEVYYSIGYCQAEYEAVEMAIKALEHLERCKKCKGICEAESMVM